MKTICNKKLINFLFKNMCNVYIIYIFFFKNGSGLWHSFFISQVYSVDSNQNNQKNPKILLITRGVTKQPSSRHPKTSRCVDVSRALMLITSLFLNFLIIQQ